jgi:hypothetical protein
MDETREIISVQVGGFSNWVGSHKWNMVHTNKSEDLDSELFVSECGELKPRVAIFDLRNRRGGLFMPETIESSIPPWSSDVHQFCTELHPRLQLNWDENDLHNQVQDSKELVWSDFMESNLKEMSFIEVPFWDVRGGSFSSYSSGDFNSSDCELSSEFKENAFDVLRILLENCDRPQGCDCTFDIQGGFAGLANSLVTEYREQCRSAAVSCAALLDPPKLPTDQTTDNIVQTNRQDINSLLISAVSTVSCIYA